jgi:hypothetical protein
MKMESGSLADKPGNSENIPALSGSGLLVVAAELRSRTALGMLCGSPNYAPVKRPRLQRARVIEALSRALEAGLMGVELVGPVALDRPRPVPRMGRARELQKNAVEAKNETNALRVLRLLPDAPALRCGFDILAVIRMRCCHCVQPLVRLRIIASPVSYQLSALLHQATPPAIAISLPRAKSLNERAVKRWHPSACYCRDAVANWGPRNCAAFHYQNG